MKKCVIGLIVVLAFSGAAWGQTDPPVFAKFISRVEIQLNRLTALISARNEAEIKLLLGKTLASRGLAEYLAELPPDYGEVTGEIVTKPTDPEGLFEVILTTQKGPRFLALTGWQEQEGKLKLISFELTPYQQRVPADLRQSLEAFVRCLQAAAKTGNKERLLELLSPGARQDRAWEFFSNLNPHPPWTLAYVALEPLSITIAVPHSPQLLLLVNAGLVAAETGWLIDTLEAVPLW